MTHQDIERMVSASRMLRIVQENLDTSAHKCETCGLTVRHNMDEHSIAAQIEGICNKLSRWIKAAEGV